MVCQPQTKPNLTMRWHKSTFAAGLLTILISMILQTTASSQGVFEIRLTKFMNKLGKDSNGHCCDGYRTHSGKCSGVCATKFRICLKHYQATIDPKHECTFGERVTPVLGNNNVFVRAQTITFPLDFKWPGTFSLIIEAWHENNKSSEGSALISRMATQQELDAGRDWTHGVHQESHTTLEYEYRMVCSAHYYGKDCDTLCRSRDDQFGHYTCGPNGEKLCLDGWVKDPSNVEGDYCTKAVCLPGCHNEHGECDRPGECKCRTGWTGPFCDECQRYPGCQHGTCRDEPWTCHCDDGWGGLFCNQDLNYCTNNRPCQNGATCFNTGQGSYTCSCSPGWTGTNCQTRITNECSHQPCVNGGTCQGTGVSNYTCVCPLGFHGAHCELRAQTCADGPCKNGAVCTDSHSTGYKCTCAPGFAGVNCDVKMDQCRMATPCQNGGTCLMISEDQYRCQCPSGFTGQHCQDNIDDCAVNPCQNGGTCIDFVSDYRCYCLPGFVGTHCEENVDECSINPCANGGTCHDSVNDFVCACRPGYTGKDCSMEINECASAPCMHNGFCVDKLNDYECRCLPGYSGKACNILPDGTVMPLRGNNNNNMDGDSSSRVALIATFSSIIPILVIVAALYLWCSKKRQILDQRRANADAKRENELNAGNCVSKTKVLDDHMIVNDLDYPRHKCVNANPNLADEETFSAKDGSTYKQMVMPGGRSKQLNTDYSGNSSRASLMLYDKLDKDSVGSSSSNSARHQIRTLDKASLSQFVAATSSSSRSSDCSSSTVSSGAPSVCSSDSHPPHRSKKKYDLPTAASIQALSGASPSPSAVYVIDEQQQRGASSYHQDDLFATEV